MIIIPLVAASILKNRQDTLITSSWDFRSTNVRSHCPPKPPYCSSAPTPGVTVLPKMANVAKIFASRAQGLLQAAARQPQVAARFSSSSTNTWEYIKTEVAGEGKNVAVITLNRPKALNALCNGLMKELSTALQQFGKDKSIAAIVLTGSEKAFAAGADIKEMLPNTYSQCIQGNFLNDWTEVARTQKPIIAAVNGYALGGGCELAMMCDIIYAGDKAKFGQPEIALGTIPGAGGTQRLTRVVGKSKAMEMCLTGNMIGAQEAEKLGLASKVVPADQLLAEAVKLGEKIGTHSNLIVQLCKESVNTAYETTLQEGLKFERRVFHATFSTADRKEGMTAFAEKRPAKFTNE
ncbi:probable enoyl-CoA hydratase, mitochondrial [Drosophila kikkawai]|uniref:enoyl-CoA hydratase n=1 Tax=Drosophila kikkawai TaxID=30033 RepID=A0A6P4IN33_DROKI